MTNLLPSVLKYFRESKIAHTERFIPPYVASACCHLVNLENQKREFYLEHGRVANLRMHMFFCSPPGFMKSLLLQRFLDGSNSVMGLEGQKAIIPHAFEGSMTEAGWTGTVRMMNDEVVTIFGAAHEHRDSIVGIEEFAALTNVLKMQHSMNLDNAMLTSLDSGLLIKRLAMGKIQYLTQITLWTGSQPARYDLTSGLGRRLFFVYFMPSKEQEDKIRLARREAKNAFPTTKTFRWVQHELEDTKKAIKGIKRIEFSDDIYKELDRIRVPHFEESLYERLALGYCIATGEIDSTVHVSMVDNRLRGLFISEKMWRDQIKRGAELTQVLEVIREMDYASVNDVKWRLTDYGIEWGTASKVIGILEKQGAIQLVQTVEKDKKGRKKTYVIALEEKRKVAK